MIVPLEVTVCVEEPLTGPLNDIVRSAESPSEHSSTTTLQVKVNEPPAPITGGLSVGALCDRVTESTVQSRGRRKSICHFQCQIIIHRQLTQRELI